MYIRSSLKKVLITFLPHIKTNTPIIIYGATGVGKEILAKEIHKLSNQTGNFVVINPSAIPENLIESELFGHKKGAFTDAREDKKGFIEEANSGSLFIDEISNISYVCQTKLLRVLDTKKIYRLGETSERFSNFRLICASNIDLKLCKTEGKFREDLYFRIKGVSIRLPNLTDEKEDILLLLEDFFKEYNKESVFTKEAQNYLENYSWPGNVRELKHFAEICSPQGIIDIGNLPYWFFDEYINNKTPNKSIKDSVDNYQKELIMQFITAGGNLRDLSNELKKSPAQVKRILNQLNIRGIFKKGRPRKI